jgi:D-glycero-alpha-D-manno-heptose 1-phosphate guanylyltransferase
MFNVSAVVLAGGLGTRLRGVLPDLPKPMAPVAGRPFVEWVVRYLFKQGVSAITISTGYRAEAFQMYFDTVRLPSGVLVRCVAEREAMGTAGGFLHAIEKSPSRPDVWLVLNGDSLVLQNLRPLLALLSNPLVGGSILALWMNDASRYGSLHLAADRLLGFQEKRPGASWINGGVYLIRDSLLKDFPRQRPLSWETDVFPELLRCGHEIAATRTHAPFLDIGTPDTLAQAEVFITEHLQFFQEI